MQTKASFNIESFNTFKGSKEGRRLPILNHLGRSKTYVPGNGHEERDLVHEHKVGRECNITVHFHDFSGDPVIFRSNVFS